MMRSVTSLVRVHHMVYASVSNKRFVNLYLFKFNPENYGPKSLSVHVKADTMV